MGFLIAHHSLLFLTRIKFSVTMSESSGQISDDVFRAGVLTTLVGGLGLWTYSQFFKRKSYLVEWRASSPGSDTKGDTGYHDAAVHEEHFFPFLTGTTAFTERPMWARTHNDIFDRVFEAVRQKEQFRDVSPEDLKVELLHIHVL